MINEKMARALGIKPLVLKPKVLCWLMKSKNVGIAKATTRLFGEISREKNEAWGVKDLVPTVLTVLSLALFLLPGQAFAQGAQGMLIYKIEGNRYLRKNYDAKGILKNYQTIEVGKLNINNDIIESKMTVLSYDEEDNLLNASQTTIRCNPEAQEVLMGIFPFAGGKPNKSLKIEMPERNELYPSGWQQGNSLPNFNFRLKLEGGAAGFFGTESRNTISQRKVSLQSEGTYRVSGKMTLKAFVAGIRISTTVYDYFEDITAEKGIVRQNFRASDGEYFTITLIEK